ncbi:MAG TPA: type II toxin-antitoxin system PemK/MazF family toxin [Candidatus Nanoarchaeia archaeon]|nr:type II toxin-antitoxin system PemK/MazF family toxin [Candidatus Nanoarchaeia archaeon]
MFKLGDVVLAQIPFIDLEQEKFRPAVVLFEDLGNIVVASITSNTRMRGIPLSIKEGTVKESVIKINYIFMVSFRRVKGLLFSLSYQKKEQIISELIKKIRSAS